MALDEIRDAERQRDADRGHHHPGAVLVDAAAAVVEPDLADRRSPPRPVLDLDQQSPDLVTPKLPALLDYQLKLQPPKPAQGTFNHAAAARGKRLFRDEARCSSCHQGPNFTDVLSGPDKSVPVLHDPAEVGMEPVYASRSATGKYRTTPLRGLQQHPPYFHDGSAPDLRAVVDHYDTLFGLNLTSGEKADLVEYLKSL